MNNTQHRLGLYRLLSLSLLTALYIVSQYPAVKTTAELELVVDVGVEVRLSAKPSKAFSTDISTGESPVQYIRNFLAAAPPMNNLSFCYYDGLFGGFGLRCE